MKVLHIHGYDSGGGAETVFNITRKNPLIENNYAGYIKENAGSGEFSDVDFVIYTKYTPLLQLFVYLFSVHNYFAIRKFLLQNKPDIIHLQGFIGALSPSILAAIKNYKKSYKVKIIQTMHEFHLICPNSVLFDYSRNELCEKCISKKIRTSSFFTRCDRRGRLYSILKGIRTIISGNIFKHEKILDVIIAPSLFLKNKLIDGGVSPGKIILVRNPVSEIAALQASDKKNIICYFGRFSKEKNLHFLLRAFVKWKNKNKNDFRLLLIGNGDEERSLKKLAVESGMKDEIIFKPFMQQDDLALELKDVKYYAMTSKCYENAPMGILEAASNNILSIVPDFGGMKETLMSVITVGGIYHESNIDSWCDTMDYLELNYGSENQKLKNRAPEMIKEYGKENYYKNLYSIYSQP